MTETSGSPPKRVDSSPAKERRPKKSNSGSSPRGGEEKNLLDMSESGEISAERKNTPDDKGKTRKAPSVAGKANGSTPGKRGKPSAGSGDSKQLNERVRELEDRLKASQAMVDSLSKEKEQKTDDGNDDLLAIMQEKLQAEMSLKAEAENKLRLAQKQISDLQTHGQAQSAEFERYRSLEETLREVTTSKEDAENNLSQALERIQKLEKDESALQELVQKLQSDLVSSREEMALQELELQKIREQRDEQERKEMALTSRLNSAKKKEAGKTNEAEKYEEELKSVNAELLQAKQQNEELRTTKVKLQKELEETIVSSRQRQVQTEAALADERKLNEERKQKMKVFIEKKSEELNQAKTENEALQAEVTQTSRSLSDLNVRWKQLHAQWVQSQTRNRELQRDLHRIKKDSENLHKVGDTLEMKLSRSAAETDEHKNKRLAAKNELMTVLRTLETEREVTARLRDSIKFTFTPKALSQQQLLNESVEDLETQLVKLSIRMRKPLPPPSSEEEGANDSSNDDGWLESLEEGEGEGAENGGNNHRGDLDTQRLIEKLNRETQQVSRCIMAVVGGIERLHLLLDAGGNRTCYTVLSEIIATSGGAVAVPTTSTGGGRQAATAETPSTEMRSITSRQYLD